MSYADDLRHPNWQKKRLEILERAEWRCEDCGAQESTLHVHHTYYEKGVKPWQYPDESLHALCLRCHAKVEEQRTRFNRALGCVSYGILPELTGYLLGSYAYNDPGAEVQLDDYEMALGFARFFDKPVDLVFDRMKPGGKITALALETDDERKARGEKEVTYLWRAVTERIRKERPLLNSSIEAAIPMSFSLGRESVLVGFEPSDRLAADMLAAPRNKAFVEALMTELVGAEIGLDIDRNFAAA